MSRIGAVLSVFRSAFGNPALRRVGFAYALFVSAEFGIWIALLIFACGHGAECKHTDRPGSADPVHRARSLPRCLRRSKAPEQGAPCRIRIAGSIVGGDCRGDRP